MTFRRRISIATVAVLAPLGLSVLVAQPAGAATGLSVTDYSQCANGTSTTAVNANTCASGWITGSLGTNNSHYREGDSVPQRLVLTANGLPAGSHTQTFSYMARKDNQGSHAYDSLATWNATVSNADKCQGLSLGNCAGGTANTYLIPDDPTAVTPVGNNISPVTSAHAIAGSVFTMYGGTITNVSVPTHDHPDAGTGDDFATIVITYTIADSTTKAFPIEFLFGGHLASAFGPLGWGTNPSTGKPLGASFINGGPYHIKLGNPDTGTFGSKDNQIKSGAIAALPAAFTITKSVSSSTAAPGAIVEYTVAIKNTGQTAGSATFTDTYQSGVVIQNDATHPLPTGCTDNPGAMQLNCVNVGPIAAGATLTLHYWAAMPVNFPDDTHKGVAPCTSTQFDVHNSVTLTTGGTSSADVCVTAAPAWAIAKSNDSPAGGVLPGALVNFTVRVTNTGTAQGTTSFSDPYGSNVTLTQWSAGCTNDATSHILTCTIPSTSPVSPVAPNNFVEFTYTAQMPGSFTSSSTPGGDPCTSTQYRIQNVATLANNGASSTSNVCVNASATFDGGKTADPSTTVPGGIVKYTLTVTNSGKAAGIGTATDVYDSSVTILNDAQHPFPTASCTNDTATRTITCTSATLNPGASATFVYYAQMPTTIPDTLGGGPCTSTQLEVINTVTIGGTPHEADVCVETSPSFVPSKSVSPTSTGPNTVVTYTVTVTNNGTGPGQASTTDRYQAGVTILDNTLPNYCSDNTATRTISCTTPTILGNGAHLTFTYQARMPASFPDNSNQGLDPCTDTQQRVDNSLTVADITTHADECVNASPSFTKTKSVSPTGPVNPGAVVTYTVVITNGGTAPGSTSFTDTYAQGVTLDDSTLPAGCTDNTATNTLSCTTGTISPIAPNNTQTFVYKATMPTGYTGALGGSGCSNTQLPVVNGVVFNTGGTASSVVVCVNMPVLTIGKAACTSATVPANGELSYTITVGNTGSAPATNVVISDQIPSGTSVANAGGGSVTTSGGVTTISWTVGTVAVGGSGVTETFTIAVDPTVTNGSLRNTAKVTSTETSATSNTVINGVGNGGAAASGRAYGVQLRLLNGNVISGLPNTTNGTTQLLALPASFAPAVAASVLTVSNTPTITALQADDTAVSTVANVAVNLGGIVSVSATAVVARSESFATGATATSSTDGSAVLGLTINGKSFGDITSPKIITVVNLLGIPVAEVDVLANVNPSGAALGLAQGAQPQGGFFSSGLGINGLDVKVLGGSLLEAVVAHAESKATFPTLTPCATGSGPYVVVGALIADEKIPVGSGTSEVSVNKVILPSTGGDQSSTVTTLGLAGLGATSGTGTETMHGTLNPLHASATAGVENLTLPGITIGAANVSASAEPAVGTTSLLNVKIDGLDVCVALGGLVNTVCNPPPNRLLLTLKKTLGIVLNEQVVVNGTIIMGAIHIFVLGAGNPLGLPVGSDLIIAGVAAGTSAGAGG